MSDTAPRAPLTLATLEKRRERGPLTLDLPQTLTLALLIHLALIGLLMLLPPAAPRPLYSERPAPLLVEFQPPKRQPAPALRPFKFVDIPDEPEVSNPNASSVSDRSRRARGPQHPPQGHKPENEDPYALGNTAERVMHAPAKTPRRRKAPAALARRRRLRPQAPVPRAHRPRRRPSSRRPPPPRRGGCW